MAATTANIDVKSQILLKVNGVVILENQYSFANNTVQYNTTLNNGSNVFEISVSNTFGSDSKLAIVNLQVLTPCTAPTVGYIAPQPNSTVIDENVIIEAQINNFIAGTLIELFHNGISVGSMTYNGATSIAAKQIVMLVGSNSFVVHVSNDCGSNQSAFVLNLKQANIPCDVPVITTTQVISGPTDNAVYDFFFDVQNVIGVSDLIATVNGIIVPISLNGTVSTFIIDDASLNVGINTVVVNAINSCGTNQYTYTITKNNCDTPTVTMISSIKVDSVNYVFTASVTEITNENDITITVNGQNINFNFNSSTGVITAGFNLQNGNNIIHVTAEGCDTENIDFNVIYTAPCNKPVISVTSLLTSTDSTYTLTATLTNTTAVVVTLNGDAIPVTFDLTTGALIATCNLIDGSNKIVIKASDCDAQTNVIYVSYTVPCNKPVIKVTSLLTSTDSIYTLTATLMNTTAVVVTLNGDAIPVTFDLTTGALIATCNLIEGSNKIVIKAIDCDVQTDVIYVSYSAPCNKPVIKVTSLLTSTDSIYTLMATLMNTTAVVVTLNGDAIPVTFDLTTGALIATCNLIEGSNKIVIKAIDCDVQTNVIYVSYTAPCNKPVIKVTSLLTSTDSIYTLTATLMNTTAVVVTLNGDAIPVTFDLTTGALIATCNLIDGSNKIVIKAIDCDVQTNVIYVSYTAPCNKPVISVTSLLTSTDSTYTLTATLTNTTAVVVTLNGDAIPVTFDLTTGALIATCNLIEGSNKIVIKAIDCDVQTNVIYVSYTAPCIAPTISSIKTAKVPMSNLDGRDALNYQMIALVTNVNDSDRITVKVNGIIISSIFDNMKQTVSAQFPIIEGVNIIEVTIVGCETVTATKKFIYASTIDKTTLISTKLAKPTIKNNFTNNYSKNSN